MAGTIPAQDHAARLRALMAEVGETLLAIAETPPERRVDELYSLAEIARRLGLSHVSVRRAINRGDLKTLTVGRRRFVSESQLAAFIVERSQDSGS